MALERRLIRAGEAQAYHLAADRRGVEELIVEEGDIVAAGQGQGAEAAGGAEDSPAQLGAERVFLDRAEPLVPAHERREIRIARQVEAGRALLVEAVAEGQKSPLRELFGDEKLGDDAQHLPAVGVGPEAHVQRGALAQVDRELGRADQAIAGARDPLGKQGRADERAASGQPAQVDIVIIGAGSVEFTRELLGDIFSFPELGSVRVVLHDINIERLRQGFWSYLPVGALIAIAMVVEMGMVLGTYFGLDSVPLPPSPEPGYSNTKALGRLLFTEYAYPFELASVVLLVAMIAAVALTLRKRDSVKKIDPAAQVAVQRNDRLRVVSMPTDAE